MIVNQPPIDDSMLHFLYSMPFFVIAIISLLIYSLTVKNSKTNIISSLVGVVAACICLALAAEHLLIGILEPIA